MVTSGRFLRGILFLFLLLCNISAFSQNFTISGYVRDSESGEDLIGATIYAIEAKKGASANTYGFYSITLPKGPYHIKVSGLGYATDTVPVNLNANRTLNFQLRPESINLEEVVIRGDAPEQQLERTQMSKVDLEVSQVKELPVLFGEVDILKTLQLLPGVQSGSEGNTGFYVRGGGPDQNLIILDEAIVYNASHLFGFFSVFNADAVRNVELYKGGFPARFGGRLSSVVEINLKEGNKKEFAGSGGLGLIASRLTLEGPLIKDKASFIVSGRRTYVDIFTNVINEAKKNNPDFNPIPDYYFYDLNTKINYELSARDRLFVSAYFGRDIFSFGRDDFDFGFNWGNATTTARWNHVFSPRLFLNTSASFTDYQYSINYNFDIFEFEIGSHISDYSIKTDFDYVPAPGHFIRFGAAATYHDFQIGRLQAKSTDNSISFSQDQAEAATEMGVYLSDDWDVNEKLSISPGLRFSAFANNPSFYSGLEPRLAFRYRVTEKVSIKSSFASMNQYIHLVSNSAASLPTDVWYPSNKIVKPQRSQQAAAGVTFLIGKQIVVTDEIYYKWLNRQIDFRDAAQLFFNENLDQEFVFGRGWSYGNEIYIEKKEGKLTGWIGYTLSWSFRQFDSINAGSSFFPRYDRRHDVSVVASYALHKRLTLSGTWVYGTGNAVSLPVAWAYWNDIPGSRSFVFPIYTERNGYRMASYHRMDLGVVWKFFPKWGTSDLTLSIYNTYNRRNPFLLYIEPNYPPNQDELQIPNGAKALQISLFPVLPSITWNFKF